MMKGQQRLHTVFFVFLVCFDQKVISEVPSSHIEGWLMQPRLQANKTLVEVIGK